VRLSSWYTGYHKAKPEESSNKTKKGQKKEEDDHEHVEDLGPESELSIREKRIVGFKV
jgi:hypothetical protein